MILLGLKTKKHQKRRNKKNQPIWLIFNYKLKFVNNPDALVKTNKEDNIIIRTSNFILFFLIAIKINDKRKNIKKVLNKNQML
jgi:hypothetical protein